jgi:hypothetical protein
MESNKFIWGIYRRLCIIIANEKTFLFYNIKMSGETLATPNPANFGIISGSFGGTGSANTGKTITLGGNLSLSGGFDLELDLTADSSVTLPTSGTISFDTAPSNDIISASGSTQISNPGHYYVQCDEKSRTIVLPDISADMNTMVTMELILPKFTVLSSANTAGAVIASLETTDYMYHAGIFKIFGDKIRNNIVRIVKATGLVDSTWDLNANGTVNALVSDGTYLYAGGTFTTVNGATTRNKICRVLLSSTTGVVDATWNMNANGTVNALVSDGTYLYAGGAFLAVNGGTTRNRMCRVLLSSTTGTVDATWNMNCASSVNVLAQDGTYLYVGGIFTTVNGATTRNRICRVLLSSTTGTVDASWDMNANGSVNALARDGTYLYIGGNFTTVNGATTRNRICRVLLSSTTGTVDATWDLNANGLVLALASDGTYLYIGGQFTTVNNLTVRRVGLCRILLSSTTGAIVDSFNGFITITSPTIPLIDSQNNVYVSESTVNTFTVVSNIVIDKVGMVIFNLNTTVQTYSGTQYIGNDPITSISINNVLGTKTFIPRSNNTWEVFGIGYYTEDFAKVT